MEQGLTKIFNLDTDISRSVWCRQVPYNLVEMERIERFRTHRRPDICTQICAHGLSPRINLPLNWCTTSKAVRTDVQSKHVALELAGTILALINFGSHESHPTITVIPPASYNTSQIRPAAEDNRPTPSTTWRPLSPPLQNRRRPR